MNPPEEWLAMNASARLELTAEQRTARLELLWSPTPAEYVAKLPRGGVQLDYCGHADTCRLIAAADPAWGWYPQAGFDELGEPGFVRNQDGYPIRLWIWLDVLGLVRPGVGTVGLGKADPEKELIGDAIRNAAMRFGVAADLWSKAPGGEIDRDHGTYVPRGAAFTGESSGPVGGQAGHHPPPQPTLAEWALAHGWAGETELAEYKQVVKDALKEMDATAQIPLWKDYQHPDTDGPPRPRSKDEHFAWCATNLEQLPSQDEIGREPLRPGETFFGDGETVEQRALDDEQTEPRDYAAADTEPF